MSGAAASLMDFAGPVARAFVLDKQTITGLMGPYGSGKTTTCMQKIVRSAFWQNPGPDGVRRVRWCVVRDTYQQLHTNVINSWKTWFPFEKHNWNGAEDRHRMTFDVVMMDGQPPQTIEIETYFRAMGDRKAEEVLKGLELTGLWLNETDTLDKSVLRFGLPRCGRYPAAKDGGCQWSGVICDFNAPDIDNWTYDLLVEKQLPIDAEAVEQLRKANPNFGIGFHRQPGGRSTNPPPENASSYTGGIEAYYAGMIAGMTPNDVRRFVDNEFGAVRNGQPVYPEYNDEIHCAKEDLRAQAGVPVCFAVDGGSTPAAVFGQIDDMRRIRWLDELVVFAASNEDALEQMGAEAFGRTLGEFWLEHFANCEFGGAWGDPAAWYGQEDEFSWVNLMWKAFRETVAKEIPAARKWKIKPAPCKGNRLPERLEAVRRPLTENRGGQPAFQISKRLRVVRRGFNNGYVVVRTQLSNGHGRWSDKPLKNDYSHAHDAGQYLNLGLLRRGAQAERSQAVNDPAKRAQAARGTAGPVRFGGSRFAPTQQTRRS